MSNIVKIWILSFTKQRNPRDLGNSLNALIYKGEYAFFGESRFKEDVEYIMKYSRASHLFEIVDKIGQLGTNK